jgi:hypothetical protein
MSACTLCKAYLFLLAIFPPNNLQTYFTRHLFFPPYPACLGAFSLGTVVSWPSLALPALQPALGLSTDQAAQVAALINIGAAVVPFFVGVTGQELRKYYVYLI